MRSNGRNALRIGELAELAGTSTRAVRHYHRIGLLDEPERDESGYRRYGAADVVRLVRIRRLRSLGMSLEEIAAALDAQGSGGDPGDQLRSLADQLTEEIERLEQLRARVLEMATSNALDDPAATWGEALSERGMLASAANLPPGEGAAAELLDALHPGGIQGVIADSSGVLSDPALAEKLGTLLRRFQALPDDAPDDEVDALAAECAAVLPVPARRPPSVDVDTMDKLIGHRLSPAKLRFVHRLRERMEERAT